MNKKKRESIHRDILVQICDLNKRNITFRIFFEVVSIGEDR